MSILCNSSAVEVPPEVTLTLLTPLASESRASPKAENLRDPTESNGSKRKVVRQSSFEQRLDAFVESNGLDLEDRGLDQL